MSVKSANDFWISDFIWNSLILTNITFYVWRKQYKIAHEITILFKKLPKLIVQGLDLVNFFMFSNFFGSIFYLYSRWQTSTFSNPSVMPNNPWRLFWYIMKYFGRFLEIISTIFFPTFGLAEFVYILRQCYQFAFLYCKIGQISTLIFGQNLWKSPQRRSTVFTITKIKNKRNQYKRGMAIWAHFKNFSEKNLSMGLPSREFIKGS